MRNFPYEDNEMLVKAQVFHNAFVEDKAEFTALFPTLADPFAANFQTKIDDADAIPSNEEMLSVLTVRVVEGNNLIKEARKKLQVLFNYADLAFDSKAMLDTFGKGNYLKALQSRIKMIDLLNQAITNAEIPANASELATVGYTAANRAELETLKSQLEEINTKIINEKESNKVMTQAREDAMNAVWEDMRKINKASKVVFADSPAKLRNYQLFKRKIKKDETA